MIGHREKDGFDFIFFLVHIRVAVVAISKYFLKWGDKEFKPTATRNAKK